MTMFEQLTNNTHNYWKNKDLQINALIRAIKRAILERATDGYTAYHLDWPEITKLVQNEHINLPFNDSFDSTIGYRRLILSYLVNILDNTDDFKLKEKINIRSALQEKNPYYIQMDIEYTQNDTDNAISGMSAISFTWDKQITLETIKNGVPDNGAFAHQVINAACRVYRDQLQVELNTIDAIKQIKTNLIGYSRVGMTELRVLSNQIINTYGITTAKPGLADNMIKIIYRTLLTEFLSDPDFIFNKTYIKAIKARPINIYRIKRISVGISADPKTHKSLFLGFKWTQGYKNQYLEKKED